MMRYKVACKYIVYILFFLLLLGSPSNATTYSSFVTSDTFINLDMNHGYGTYNYLNVGHLSSGEEYKTLVNVPFTSYDIPSSATVTAASLHMYLSGGTTVQSIYVYRAVSGWNEASNYMPAYGGSLDFQTVFSPGWYSWNIKSAIDTWRGAYPPAPANDGLVLAVENIYGNYASFNSREASSDRPYITIEYTINSAPSTPVTVQHPVYMTTASTNVSWAASTDPDGDLVSYHYKVGTTSGGGQVFNSATTFELHSINWNPSPTNTYYYTAQACDSYNACSAWAAEKSFAYSSNQTPPVPSLITHSNYISQGNTQVTWSASVDPEGDSVTYNVRVGDAPGGSNILPLTSTPYEFSNIFTVTPSNTYYWSVQACDHVDGMERCSAWATESSFTYIGGGSGAVDNGSSTISGIVYHSVNGVMTPIKGAIVYITKNDFTYSNSIVTGVNGSYLFTNLSNSTSFSLKATKSDEYDDSQPYYFTTGLGSNTTYNIQMMPCSQSYGCLNTYIESTILVRHSSDTFTGNINVPFARINFSKQGDMGIPSVMYITDENGVVIVSLKKTQIYQIDITKPSEGIIYQTFRTPSAEMVIIVDNITISAPNLSVTPFPNISYYENRDNGYPSVFDDFNSTSMESSIGLGVMGQSILVGLLNWIFISAGGMLMTFFVSGILIWLGVLSMKIVLFFAITGISIWYITRT